MVWDYSHSPEEPLEWPDRWPDLKNENTVDRESIYSIYLDSKYFSELNELLQQRKEKQAIEINGKKYSVSYRLPFPNL
jgi:hypothetical protein